MKCDLCEFETLVKEQYAGHRSSHVRRGELEKRPARGKTEHRCKICEKEFHTGPALGSHSRTHWSPKKLASILIKSNDRKGAARKAFSLMGGRYECAICGLPPEWQGKQLTMQLDHIDGDRGNNEFQNLRFLCPNCHTQTPTYGSKKRITK